MKEKKMEKRLQEMLNQSRSLLSIITILFSLNAIVGQSVTGDQSGDTLMIVTQPIPIENVIQKISDANDDIKIIRRKTGQNQGVKKIDSLFPSYAKFLSAQEKVAEKFIKSNPNRQKINNQIKTLLKFSFRRILSYYSYCFFKLLFFHVQTHPPILSFGR